MLHNYQRSAIRKAASWSFQPYRKSKQERSYNRLLTKSLQENWVQQTDQESVNGMLSLLRCKGTIDDDNLTLAGNEEDYH